VTILLIVGCLLPEDLLIEVAAGAGPLRPVPGRGPGQRSLEVGPNGGMPICSATASFVWGSEPSLEGPLS